MLNSFDCNGMAVAKALVTPDPQDPENVRNKNIQGQVILAIGSSQGGNVEVAKIAGSLEAEVDEAAVRAIRQ